MQCTKTNQSSVPARRQRGYNLIEITLYVVIAAILAGISFRAYSDSNKASQISRVARDIQTVASRVVAIYQASGDFSGLGVGAPSAANCAPIVNNQAFDNTVFTTTGTGANATAQHGIGQGYIFCAAFNLNGANDAFYLALGSISDADCPQVVNAIQGSVKYVAIDATTVQSANGVLSPSAVGTACGSSSYTNQHLVQLVFSRT